MLALLAACGPSRADEAGPQPDATRAERTTVPPATSTATPRTTSGTIARPTVVPTTAPATLPPVTTAAPAVRTPAVERPDPEDAPPVDATPAPRSSNAGDFSSPYGPFGPFEVQQLSSERTAAVQGVVDLYLELAVLGPLRAGGSAELGGLLTPAALAGLSPQERGVLTDEGFGPAPDVATTARAVRVEGIVAPDGSAVADAQVELAVAGTEDGVPVTTRRTGNLTFVLDAGQWKLDAFALQVDRDVP